MGMIIRKGISNTVSIESGINYVKRNYNLSIADSASERTTSFTIVGYEIPVTGMVFIQHSKGRALHDLFYAQTLCQTFYKGRFPGARKPGEPNRESFVQTHSNPPVAMNSKL